MLSSRGVPSFLSFSNPKRAFVNDARIVLMLGHVVPNNVAICCVEMLRAFGQLLHNILQHDPTMLRYVALKGCERLTGALS